MDDGQRYISTSLAGEPADVSQASVCRNGTRRVDL